MQQYASTVDLVTGELSFKRFNSRGQQVCPEHGYPMHGHQSIKKQGPQGNEVTDYHKEYLKIYRADNPKRPIGTVGEVDRRDNRDPSKIGAAFLSRKNKRTEAVKTNGRVE